ncbi:hypothetical protein HZB88_00330 [archaeon]|nr:hypothetical protein [archaeon]
MASTIALPIISFFEEFPNETTLEKITQIDFDTRIYVAARNLLEFQNYEEEYKSRNERIREVIYWPILEKEEGYWFSPWSEPEALKRVFEEVKEREDKTKLEVLLDLEPPLQRARLFSFRDFRQNKEYITNFVRMAEDYNVSISTVEKSCIPDWILEPLGLSFAPEEYKNKKIKMYYSSYRRRVLPGLIVDKLYERKVEQYAKKKIHLGIGLIAPGIHNETHSISPENLQREIEIASKQGIEEVIIFRLDGLNDDYLRAIHGEIVNKSN